MEGKESFRRAKTEFRNMHVVAGIAPLIVMRQELIGNDEFRDRGGTDDPTADHFRRLLLNCDNWRRKLTHNPDKLPLGDKIAKAVDPSATIDVGQNPFGGDDIQNMSGGMIELPFALDGSDPNIPMISQLRFNNSNGLLFLQAIDRAIVNWTRLNSKDRTRFITQADSMRIYGDYQEMLGFINSFMGDANRIDVAQMLPSEEPLGPTDSPNMVGESAHTNPSPSS